MKEYKLPLIALLVITVNVHGIVLVIVSLEVDMQSSCFYQVKVWTHSYNVSKLLLDSKFVHPISSLSYRGLWGG